MNILYCIQELCKPLSAIDRLQHVSIVFLETKIASWSTDGELRMSTGLLQQLRDEPDLEYAFDIFATLNNVTKATIELPHSVADDLSLCGQSLHDFKARLEQSMMNLDPLDQGPVGLAINLVDVHQEYLEYQELNLGYMELIQGFHELDIQTATWRRSMARRKVQGYDVKRSGHTCRVWDTTPKR